MTRFCVLIRYHGADAEHSRYGLLLVAEAVARRLRADGQAVRVCREVER